MGFKTYFVENLVLKSGHALSDTKFLMPQIIGFTHDKQLLDFTPNHTPSLLQALSQELLLQPYPRYYME